jgi:orotate phosphoribosyltransferase
MALPEILDEEERQLALDLFPCFEAGTFLFKHHESDPSAPPSPFRWNLTTPTHPRRPGNLTPDLQSRCGALLFRYACLNSLGYDAVAGIPLAGEAFAQAFLEAAFEKNEDLICVYLEKEESGGKRRICRAIPNPHLAPGARLLLIDDLVTRAHSKLEAIKACEEPGYTVPHLLVLIDRSGDPELRPRFMASGRRLHAVWQQEQLLHLYQQCHLITPSFYETCMGYLHKGRPI